MATCLQCATAACRLKQCSDTLEAETSARKHVEARCEAEAKGREAAETVARETQERLAQLTQQFQSAQKAAALKVRQLEEETELRLNSEREIAVRAVCRRHPLCALTPPLM